MSDVQTTMRRTASAPSRDDRPEKYLPSDDLNDAIDVALMLNRPLLVTGPAGCGKTQLAEYVRWRERLPVKHVFETKSTSSGQDLFYTYNTLARFHAAQVARTTNAGSGTPEAPLRSSEYITYRALGIALLMTHQYDDVSDVLPTGTQRWHEPVRSVVLIDEIDKAPHDFPNDILNEIDQQYFRILELGNREVRCGRLELAPIIVLTSNSEKALPEPFLRRCVYFHIRQHNEEQLRSIVRSRLAEITDPQCPLLNQALHIFQALSGRTSHLDKKPSTAELLDWLLALQGRKVAADADLRKYPRELRASMCALIKGEQDRSKALTWLIDHKWLPATND